MDIHRLLGDELTYELQIRGQPIGGTVKQKRDALRAIISEERSENICAPSEVNIEPNFEISVCEGKLADLDEQVNNFDNRNAKADFKRIHSRLYHLNLRLNRIRGNSELIAVRDGLIAWCQNLLDEINKKYKESQEMEHLSPMNLTLLDTDNPLLPDTVRTEPSQGNTGMNQTLEQSLIDLELDDGIGNLARSKNSESAGFLVTDKSAANQMTQPNRVSHLRTLFEPEVSSQNPIQVHNRNTERVLFRQSTARTFEDLVTPFPTRACLSLNAGNQNRIQQSGNDCRGSSEIRQISSPNQVQYGPGKNDLAINSLAPNRIQESSDVPNIIDSSPPHREQPFQVSTGIPTTFTQNSENPYLCDISRWKIQYDGLSSVTNFLERLEELRLSRGVSKERLLRSAVELFSKDALLWFRMNQFSSWDELVEKLKAAFQPFDYEYSLWEEIRRRTQGTHERVISYVSVMESLFKKLPNVPAESHRVELIRRNMLPNIQTQLSIQLIKNLADLVNLARAIEETNWRVQKYQPPPSNTRYLLEPELAYRKPISTNVAPVQVEYIGNSPLNDAVADISPSTSNAPICWNCKGTGHRFKKCTQPKQIFCFKCGKPNTVSTSCGCAKNGRTPRRH